MSPFRGPANHLSAMASASNSIEPEPGLALEEDLARRADALRQQLAPLPHDKVLAAWARVPSTPVAPQGSSLFDVKPFLSRHSLAKGSIPGAWEGLSRTWHGAQCHARTLTRGRARAGDHRCQFVAVSRALFSDDSHADELRSLAVLYLRLHTAEYSATVAVCVSQCYAELQKLSNDGKITSVGYVGYLEAIEKGHVWGEDHTLRALAILLRVEARVLKNTGAAADCGEPRLVKLCVSPQNKVGAVDRVVYLFLEIHHGKHHYSTLEDAPGALAAEDDDSTLVECEELLTVLGQVRVGDDDDMLTPTGYSPPTQQPIWPTANTAHNQHCGHTALPPV